jgi:hypothetical protein
MWHFCLMIFVQVLLALERIEQDEELTYEVVVYGISSSPDFFSFLLSMHFT